MSNIADAFTAEIQNAWNQNWQIENIKVGIGHWSALSYPLDTRVTVMPDEEGNTRIWFMGVPLILESGREDYEIVYKRPRQTPLRYSMIIDWEYKHE